MYVGCPGKHLGSRCWSELWRVGGAYPSRALSKSIRGCEVRGVAGLRRRAVEREVRGKEGAEGRAGQVGRLIFSIT